ncbi:MAG: glycosyltransferase family 4 protein [Aridibacter famidurans]|nr:glycosyltransferase family 4 protein [Aridibacter famidurans]
MTGPTETAAGVKPSVLITSPNLDSSRNVSGISTLVRDIVASDIADFHHFTAGRKDGERSGPVWVFRQIFLPLRFIAKLVFSRIDLVHINTSFQCSAILRDSTLVRLARVAGVPSIVHIHGGPLLYEGIPGGFLRRTAAGMLGRCSIVLVLSSIDENKVLELCPEARVSVLPNAVRTNFRVDRGPETFPRSVIFCGRIQKAKGLETLIDTVEILRKQGTELRFECYGTGPDEAEFVERMRTVLGGSFRHHGVADTREIWKAYSGADIFFLPSNGEGLPLSLLESMAAGCVPVVTDVGANSVVIEHGRNGFIFPPGSAEEFASALSSLLTAGVDLSGLRSEAVRTLESRFSFDSFLEHLSGIYEDLRK